MFAVLSSVILGKSIIQLPIFYGKLRPSTRRARKLHHSYAFKDSQLSFAFPAHSYDVFFRTRSAAFLFSSSLALSMPFLEAWKRETQFPTENMLDAFLVFRQLMATHFHLCALQNSSFLLVFFFVNDPSRVGKELIWCPFLGQAAMFFKLFFTGYRASPSVGLSYQNVPNVLPSYHPAHRGFGFSARWHPSPPLASFGNFSVFLHLPQPHVLTSPHTNHPTPSATAFNAQYGLALSTLRFSAKQTKGSEKDCPNGMVGCPERAA